MGEKEKGRERDVYIYRRNHGIGNYKLKSMVGNPIMFMSSTCPTLLSWEHHGQINLLEW